MKSPCIIFLLCLARTCISVPQDKVEEIKGDIKTDLKFQCGHASYDCVPYFQCVDGIINTDGTGLLDVRIASKEQGVCTNPEYPDVPGICCLIPGAVPTPEPIKDCPAYKECVEYHLCSADGKIVSDGSGIIDIRITHTSCYLPSGIGGICCTPPSPFLDVCPEESVCTPKEKCLSKALDYKNNFIDHVSTGLWTHCPYEKVDGVCCIPPAAELLDKCPGDSVCLPSGDCKGTALKDSDNFIDYTGEGSWTSCLEYDKGVCCINPFVDPGFKAAPECGIRNYKIDSRITGKIDSAFGEFPWQGIIFYQNYTFNCGATLVSKKYAITAAHCVHKLLASDIRLRFGEWMVSSFDEPLPYIDRNVYAVHIHPKYNPANLHNDIAVLELLEPIDYQYHINGICLPQPGQIFDLNTICVTTGWGKDAFHGTFQHILKKIEVPFVDHDACESYLRKTRLGKYFKLDKSFVCAGGEKNKDACYGDGGGPLACKSGDNYFLTGITSWGIGCGTKGVPGVYVDVQRFVKWIEEIAKTDKLY